MVTYNDISGEFGFIDIIIPDDSSVTIMQSRTVAEKI